MAPLRRLRPRLWTLAACAAACLPSYASEHVTLKNGFELDCVRRESIGERVRLYFDAKTAGTADYMEVAASAIARTETFIDPPVVLAVKHATAIMTPPPTQAEMNEMLSQAGQKHHIDADMLASVIKAESGGRIRAVSRTGAKGLMQLMPGTASQLGVEDSFRADQNIAGGTAYLDQLLTRYHDNVAFALAAYNAGPAAVDRWHGIPPYRETQAYVVRVIREFNRRKQLLLTASAK